METKNLREENLESLKRNYKAIFIGLFCILSLVLKFQVLSIFSIIGFVVFCLFDKKLDLIKENSRLQLESLKSDNELREEIEKIRNEINSINFKLIK